MDWGAGRGRGGWFKLGPFLYRKYKRGMKKPNVSSSLHPVNNIEHNIKQNIYTGMEIISLIPK